MNLKYITLFSIVLLLAVSSYNAYAVNSIDWTYAGFPWTAPSAFTNIGNIWFDFGLPFSVIVDATDEEDFTTNGIIDKIDVLVTSVADPLGTTYTLTETGPYDGIFTGTNFVFLDGNYKYQTTDIVNLVYVIDPTSICGSDGEVTQLDTRIGGNDKGIRAYSDSDLSGLGLVLTETGINTCTFEGQLKFTTTGTSDEDTGTLRVSQGDILAFHDTIMEIFYNGQIVPVVDGKGSIIAYFDDPDVADTAEVTVTYNGLSAGLDLNDPGGGGGTGSGGPIVRPGLVLNVIASLFGGGSLSAPPTLGLNQNHQRIVDGGFSFNGNPVNVEQYYTPYPLITTPVGQNNTIKLKIYEERGPDNIAHVGLSYGLGKGETFNEGRATIEFDRTFDGIESVNVFDPKDVLGSVNVTTSQVQCSQNNKSTCLEVTFDHMFREPLEYNMVATNIWDLQRNGWQNYFNHGIHIVGESMNPPEEYSGMYRGNIYHLTETGKYTAVDEDGNRWTFDRTWNRDYIKPVKADADILNPIKINAIEKLGFSYSDGQEIFGYERVDHRFADAKDQQQLQAKNIMNNLCPQCQEEPFENIDDILSHDMPDIQSKLQNPEIQSTMKAEEQKAQEFLRQYFEKMYPGKVND